ncbi:response regulator transcription factor [Rothia halotolerans]|uniref:response regulator transcription factor n=1 Tax=Rothia halotolerans TaxID=405770 RepID=UPI00101CF1D2|nr:response regulator transcription factor [Rothia halotolerans]
MTTTVLLADDERLIRSALTTLLPLEADLEVVAEAGDGAEAVRLFSEQAPDVVILDLEMPVMDGLEAARHIAELDRDAALVILTRHARPGTLRSALRAGVRGFLGKDAEPALIAEVAVTVAGGGRFIDAHLSAQALMDDCPLTEREQEVLRGTREGYSPEEIGRRLRLAHGTVRNYLSSAIQKTHSGTRHEAARTAHESGWL